VAKLADAPDLGSGAVRCGGSSPSARKMIDHFLFEIRTAKKIIEDSIVEIKSYSTKRAKKDLQELYILEDAIEHLVEIAKSLKPESKKEEILLKEFIAFGDTFINMIALVEVMSLPLSRRKRIMSKDKIASRGSRILKSEDLLD
jgi:hypothetical protein